MKRFTVVLVALATPLMVWSGPATADDETEADQCVMHVIDELETGELVLSDPECYETFDEAMVQEGVDVWGADAAARAEEMSAAADFPIAVHWDGFNQTGASAVIVGSNCSGGWLNVSAAWDNRISSTQHGCARIRHFAGANLTGTNETTLWPTGNLSTLNNATTSVQYLS